MFCSSPLRDASPFRSSLPLVEEDASVFCSSLRRDASPFRSSPPLVEEDASAFCSSPRVGILNLAGMRVGGRVGSPLQGEHRAAVPLAEPRQP